MRAEGVLQVDRLRRGALHLLLEPAHHALDRAQQPAVAARGLEQVADQEGGGGLAVGAGDAHQLELGRGVAVEAGGGRAHGGAHVVDHELRHPEPERALADERRGARASPRRGRSRGRPTRNPGTQKKSAPGVTLWLE